MFGCLISVCVERDQSSLLKRQCADEALALRVTIRVTDDVVAEPILQIDVLSVIRVGSQPVPRTFLLLHARWP